MVLSAVAHRILRSGFFRGEKRDMNFLLALIGTLLFAPLEEPVRETRSWTSPNGDRVELEWIAGSGEIPIADGDYVCAFADGAKLEGRFRNGEQHGTWGLTSPEGKPQWRGRYRSGRRDGKWTFYFPGSRKKQAAGNYEEGYLAGSWSRWDADGKLNKARSGKYASVERSHASGTLSFRGTKLTDKENERSRFDGTCRGYWENGQLQFAGEYLDGLPSGAWSFWHPNGYYDPDFISGFYEAGVRTRALTDKEHNFWLVMPPEFNAPEITAFQIATKSAGASKPNPADDAIAKFLVRAKREPIPQELKDCTPLPQAQGAIPAVLSTLAGFDLTDAEALNQGARLHRFLELSLNYKHSTWDLSPEAQEQNRLTIMRWGSVVEIFRSRFSLLDIDGVLRQKLVPNLTADAAGIMSPLLADTANIDRYQHRLTSNLANDRASGGRKNLSDRELKIAEGLDWLARHARAEGGWDCDEFFGTCTAEDACNGVGIAEFDPGVTGLALLAFFSQGQNHRQGEHQQVIAGGVLRLLAGQDKDGLLAPMDTTSFMYNHTIATLALVEAWGSSGDETLRQPVQRAVDYLDYARDPYGVWRYDVPSVGEGDTSVTGWAMSALIEARELGAQVNVDALRDGRDWAAQNTDPETGRTGYDAPGTRSSRVFGVNAHFPAELGECLTAEALRYLLELQASFEELVLADPAHESMQNMRIDRLRKRLPAWEPEVGNDMLYWYFGSVAFARLRLRETKTWERWSSALDQVLENQIQYKSCQRGSWDPNGPWGYAGGRVYSTALMVLSAAADGSTLPLPEQ